MPAAAAPPTLPDSPFPVEIAFAVASPDEAVPPPLEAERSLLSPNASPERVQEFARGRHCARRALAAMGMADAESRPVLRHGARQPRWPAGVVGTITHSHGWAAAAVAPSARFAGVGLDLETVREPSEALLRRTTLPVERRWLGDLPEDQRADAYTLLFSAKEAIYKALHPATGVFLGFYDAQVWIEPPDAGALGPAGAASEAPIGTGPAGCPWRASGAVRWQLLAPCGGEFPVGYRGVGAYRVVEDRVLTGVWVPRRR